MIVDARPANAMFKRPPHTPLCNSEIFAGFESRNRGEHTFAEMTGPCEPVYLGVADVDNCFHRIRISENLGCFFCLPGQFTAKELGIIGSVYQGRVLSADSIVRVRCAALPMGFGWSLYFAQRINATFYQFPASHPRGLQELMRCSMSPRLDL